MKFKTADLQAAVVDAIAAAQIEHAGQEGERLSKRQTAEAEWCAKYSEKWAAAGTRIARKARKGQVIQDTDLPRDEYYSGRSAATFRWDERKPQPYVISPELKVLSNVLSLLVDEEVTDGQLSRLGVRSNTIRYLAASMSTPKA